MNSETLKLPPMSKKSMKTTLVLLLIVVDVLSFFVYHWFDSFGVKVLIGVGCLFMIGGLLWNKHYGMTVSCFAISSLFVAFLGFSYFYPEGVTVSLVIIMAALFSWLWIIIPVCKILDNTNSFYRNVYGVRVGFPK